LFLVDNAGRKIILLIETFGGALCMYAVGAYIPIAKPTDSPTSKLGAGGIVATFFFYLQAACTSLRR
jgi:hypothetical protein